MRADEAVHRSVNHHFSDIPQFYDVHADEIHIQEGGLCDNKKEQLKQITDKDQVKED